VQLGEWREKTFRDCSSFFKEKNNKKKHEKALLLSFSEKIRCYYIKNRLLDKSDFR